MEKTLKEIAKKADAVEGVLKEDFKIEGQEMTVLCPEAVQRYSIALIPKTSHLLPKSKKFVGIPRRIDFRQVRGLSHIDGAIETTDDGFKVNLKPLTPGELYILDIEYPVDDHRFVDSLVDRTVPRDVPHNSEDLRQEYWMSAQLKHVGVLKQKYYRVNLRDVDFAVDVAVAQDVKITVPGIFKLQLETSFEMLKKKGRSEMWRLMMRHRGLQAQKYGGNQIKILQNLYDLFTPLEFKKFVEVLKDFHYWGCTRGSDFYNTLPFPTWPKSMRVVSRTDLNLEQPAAEGVVVYKRNDFVTEIEKLFGISKKRQDTAQDMPK